MRDDVRRPSRRASSVRAPHRVQRAADPARECGRGTSGLTPGAVPARAASRCESCGARRPTSSPCANAAEGADRASCRHAGRGSCCHAIIAVRRRFAPRSGASRHGAHALRQVVGQPRGPRGSGRHGAALHRPPPRARGDEPAGVRRAEARRPQAVARGVGRGHRRPQHADQGLEPRHHGSDLARAGRDARRQHPRARREGLLPVPRPPPGHRARDRARAGRDAAGHDGRLRRLAHEHARRVRRARVRDRHVRGRARARHAVPAHEEGEVDARPRRRPAAGRRDGEGPRADDHRPHRHRRRHRPRDRVRGRGRARAVDGSADDPLQHGDRSRRPRGHGRRRPAHDRLRQGPAARAVRRPVGPRGRALAHAHERRRRALRHDARVRRRGDPAAGHVGHVARDGAADRRPRARSGQGARLDAPRRHRARAVLHGPPAEHADRRHPHRQGVHRLVHEFAHRGPAAGGGGGARAPRRGQREARDGRAGVGPREGAGGSRGPRPHLPATRASSGASRDARCASR